MMRDPTEYRPDPDGHFEERVAEREVPETVITKAIRSGNEVEKPGGRVEITTTYLQEDYIVVIDPRYQYLITAYRK